MWIAHQCSSRLELLELPKELEQKIIAICQHIKRTHVIGMRHINIGIEIIEALVITTDKGEILIPLADLNVQDVQMALEQWHEQVGKRSLS